MSRLSIQSKKTRRVLSYLIKLFIGLVFVSPLFIGLIYSFTPSKLLYFLPTFKEYFETLTFENFTWVWNYLPLMRYTLNTFVVCALVISVQIFLSSLAAYSFASFKYPLKTFLFTLKIFFTAVLLMRNR